MRTQGELAMTEWTSVRIERDTLDQLNEVKRDDESHDDLVNRLLDEVGVEKHPAE